MYSTWDQLIGMRANGKTEEELTEMLMLIIAERKPEFLKNKYVIRNLTNSMLAWHRKK